MSDLLPQVDPASSEEEEIANEENEIEIINGAEGELQVLEPPDVKRHVPEQEVFPALEVHPVRQKKKRPVSQKQLEHLARCRKLAAAKRAAKRAEKPSSSEPAQEMVAQVNQPRKPAQYTADDMEAFADQVLDKYQSRRSQGKKQSRAEPIRERRTAAREAVDVTAAVKSREDEAYEFWSAYF